MGQVVATIKVMPEGVEVNLEELKEKVSEILKDKVEIGKIEEEEIAFGLKSVNFVIVADETKGSLDPLADEIGNIDGVKSAEITNVTRAMG